MFTPYTQFNPALGVLHEVDITISGNASSNRFFFTNSTSSPITFNASIELELGLAESRAVALTSTFSETLDPFHRDSSSWSASGPISASASYTATANNLDYWIGTLTLNPDVNLGPVFATVSDPGIAVAQIAYGQSIMGTESVTYIYGLVVPEPASVVMLSFGLVGVAGMTWYRRAA